MNSRFAKSRNVLLALVLSLSTLLLSLSFFFVQSAYALDNSSWTEDDFVIATEGNEKIIKTWSEQGLEKLNAGNTDLLIPDGITTIGKTNIPGEDGLVHKKGQNQIKSVTLPSSVRVINYGAFHGHAIKTINFSEGLEKIDSGAFVDNQLEKLILPKSLKYIGWTAFQGNQITSLAFKDNMNDLTINDPWTSGTHPAFDNQVVKNIRIKKGESIRPINISINNDSLLFQTVYAPSAESTQPEPISEFVETDKTGLITAKKVGKTFVQHAAIWNAKDAQGNVLGGTHYISSKYEIEVYDSAKVSFDPNGGTMTETDKSQEVELGKQTSTTDTVDPSKDSTAFKKYYTLPKTDDANSIAPALALFASISFATAFTLRKLYTIR